jgi:hypothetical protein
VNSQISLKGNVMTITPSSGVLSRYSGALGLVSDEGYAEKADGGMGGVGWETMIVWPENKM